MTQVYLPWSAGSAPYVAVLILDIQVGRYLLGVTITGNLLGGLFVQFQDLGSSDSFLFYKPAEVALVLRKTEWGYRIAA